MTKSDALKILDEVATDISSQYGVYVTDIQLQDWAYDLNTVLDAISEIWEAEQCQ